MTKPFSDEPNLVMQYPSAQDLEIALHSGASDACKAFVRLWLTEGVPNAFREVPAVYEDLRGWLGSRIGVHAKEIVVLGSARLGYSLCPLPEFGRAFSSRSDLDLAIVSESLFASVRQDFIAFSTDFERDEVTARNPTEHGYWVDNIKSGALSIGRGFIDSWRVPNFYRYRAVQPIADTMSRLKRRLDETPRAPKIRKASIRAYRDWTALIDRVEFNVRSALQKNAKIRVAGGRN